MRLYRGTVLRASHEISGTCAVVEGAVSPYRGLGEDPQFVAMHHDFDWIRVDGVSLGTGPNSLCLHPKDDWAAVRRTQRCSKCTCARASSIKANQDPKQQPNHPPQARHTQHVSAYDVSASL